MVMTYTSYLSRMRLNVAAGRKYYYRIRTFGSLHSIVILKKSISRVIFYK